MNYNTIFNNPKSALSPLQTNPIPLPSSSSADLIPMQPSQQQQSLSSLIKASLFSLKIGPSLNFCSLPSNINWNIDGDMPRLWKAWAEKQTDTPIGFSNIKNVKYFDSQITPFRTQFLIIQFDLEMEYTVMVDQKPGATHQVQDALTFQYQQDTPIYQLVPSMRKVPENFDQIVQSLPLSVSFDGLIFDQSVKNSFNQDKVQYKLEEFVQKQVEQKLPKDYTDLKIKLSGFKSFVAEAEYIVQKYRFDKTERFVIVCAAGGEMIGEASKSQTIMKIKGLFK